MFELVLSPDIALTLDKAFLSHHHWKRRLQEAASSGEILDVETIRRDDCCDLGQWLHGEGNTLYGTRPVFRTLVNKHAEFHAVTAVVAEIINQKSYEQAHSHLEGSSQFSSASTDVGIAILRLKAAAALAQQPPMP